MSSVRKYITTFMLLWPMLVMSQVCDFELRNFRENLTDLTAASSNVKDLNGVTAALLRFSVRDTLFQIDTNLGSLKQEKRVGEILLFVPQGIKRLTIRHPHLGVMRDYQIPLAIESKTTYDVDVLITNEAYLHSLYSKEQDKPAIIAANEGAKTTEKPHVEPMTAQPKPQEKPQRQKKTFKFPDTHFMLGAGFNALSVMGPSVNIGVEIGKFMLSADYTIGMEKVEGVGIYYKFKNGEGMGEAYDYKSSRLSLRVGLNFNPDATFQIVPQIGASLGIISGSDILDNSVESQFSKSNPVSMFAAVSMRLKLAPPLYLYVTPQYDFIVGKDEVFDVIKEADSKIKAWGEGFGVQAGLLLRF